MILQDDKLAPPPYTPRRRTGNGPKLSDLPSSLLLQIVESMFLVEHTEDGLYEQRRTLYWLTTGLRLVNRGFYVACMHTLRSTYLESYFARIKPPYTSDPFPFSSTEATGSTESIKAPPIRSLQRETEVFDLFIALKAREDVWLDDTMLHLEKEDSFNDLFAVIQPRRRLEDLLRYYGLRYGSVTLSESPYHTQKAVSLSRLSISFSQRKVGLVLYTPATRTSRQQKTVIVECTRDKDEQLEVAAKKLAKGLCQWIAYRR
ncbi:hypothetical protein M422DRAFT_68386 [Sphaerobolus stellatus SS14]|uniref:Uncharacterized protein n=1 Tax=Sphaerobolus stellatus (strain SS14) TaxID=990650 RepID=A0A0C9VI31_SPHS4|nr:hypothetical protein M422DRAFT_68386 [Sphaerobolus stellatus SS14]